jgi:hypothetical protein
VNNQDDAGAATTNRDHSSDRSPIVGTWSNGYSSIWSGYRPTTGPQSFTPGRSHAWKYIFHPNGTFEFTGLMQMTVYSCTTTYFQDKRGQYAINGNRITLTLSKNFWRKQEGCSPSSNTEIDHKLDPETYTFRVKRNQYGKNEVCLDRGDGESCYESANK